MLVLKYILQVYFYILASAEMKTILLQNHLNKHEFSKDEGYKRVYMIIVY